MSGISETNPTAGSVTQPGLTLRPNTSRPKSAQVLGGPSGTSDRLEAVSEAAKHAGPPDPSALAARVRQLQAPLDGNEQVPVPPSGSKSDNSHRGNLFSPLSNLAISFLTSPRFVIKHTENLFASGTRLLNGGRRAKQLAIDLKHAVDEGRSGRFIQGNARLLRLSAAARKQAAIQVIRRGRLEDLMKVLNGSKPSNVVNEGMVHYYRLARQEGRAPLQATARAFSKTVETGGNMPQITEEAARLGGRMGRALTWAGRIGRVAPLLNVPLAVFDISSAVQSLGNPRASTRDRIAKTGRAALTTAAAGLAVAGFVTPPPINLTLLGVAAGIGLGSTLWSVATGATVASLARGAGHAVMRATRWLGL